MWSIYFCDLYQGRFLNRAQGRSDRIPGTLRPGFVESSSFIPYIRVLLGRALLNREVPDETFGPDTIGPGAFELGPFGAGIFQVH